LHHHPADRSIDPEPDRAQEAKKVKNSGMMMQRSLAACAGGTLRLITGLSQAMTPLARVNPVIILIAAFPSQWPTRNLWSVAFPTNSVAS
jgi:hypothetical protein